LWGENNCGTRLYKLQNIYSNWLRANWPINVSTYGENVMINSNDAIIILTHCVHFISIVVILIYLHYFRWFPCTGDSGGTATWVCTVRATETQYAPKPNQPRSVSEWTISGKAGYAVGGKPRVRFPSSLMRGWVRAHARTHTATPMLVTDHRYRGSMYMWCH